MAPWLDLYHRLPGPLRTIAASARGYYLRWWRYGSQTERLVEEALERESWSPAQWRAWREERLAFVLHRAATRVPYYREQWQKRRRLGDRAAVEYLENWPVLKKETLRQNPRAFVADDCNIRKMYEEHTSGSTGKPLSLWLSRETVQKWYALFEARWRRWYGLSRFDRWAILGGQLIVPYSQKKPPFWVWNQAFHQLYMSSYHLSPDQIPFYLEALKRFRIKYIYAYTSSVYALAQEILRQERTDIKMVVILTNAEPLYEYQRQAIEKAFQCPVRETYGMSEIVADASECRNGGLHLWPEVGMVEILEEGLSVKPGKVGELICTGLLNADMPLIRYQVGDRGALSPENFCTCRRTLPKLKMIEGRIDDLLFTADGRKVGRLDPVFKANLPIKEAQIIQESLDVLTVRYIPAPGFSSKSKRIIARRLQERMGGVKVIFEEVDYLPRDSNGKFRAVVCKLPQEQIRSLRVSLT